MPDPNIETLNRLADDYHAAQDTAKQHRIRLYAYIQELKREGYTYPCLAREAGFSLKGIQNIVAQDPGK